MVRQAEKDKGAVSFDKTRVSRPDLDILRLFSLELRFQNEAR